MIKKLLLTLIITTFWASAQNLTISQLVAIKNMNISDAEEYLTEKDWNIKKLEQNKEKGFSIISFYYAVVTQAELQLPNVVFDNSEIHLFFDDNEGYIDMVFMETSDDAKYMKLLKEIKAYGTKFYDSFMDDDRFIKIYQGATITFVVIVEEDKGSFTQRAHYGIIIMDTDFFKYSKLNRK